MKQFNGFLDLQTTERQTLLSMHGTMKSRDKRPSKDRSHGIQIPFCSAPCHMVQLDGLAAAVTGKRWEAAWPPET